MKYKIVKLDARYSHRSRFQYMISFTKAPGHSAILDFDRCRRWLNDTYGWSQDVEMQIPMSKAKTKALEEHADIDINRHWAYNIKYDDYRIYLATSDVLTMFQLKWAQ